MYSEPWDHGSWDHQIPQNISQLKKNRCIFFKETNLNPADSIMSIFHGSIFIGIIFAGDFSAILTYFNPSNFTFHCAWQELDRASGTAFQGWS